MSRIEEAMEKAGRLREQAVPAGQANSVTGKAPSPSHQRPAETIEILSPRLVVANDYNLPIAEEYRKLKSSIVQLTNRGQRQTTLMVTSSVGGEGKSVTALNLAISLAQEYDQHVILIDADIRKPSICRYLGIGPRPGLVDCLMDGVDIDDVLVNTGLGNLLLLPTGREAINPVEILASQKMKDFLNQMKQRFAGYYIIFDISPTLPFAEASVVGSMVDGVIFVVKEGGASPKNITEALGTLKETNILGTVYNKATTSGLNGGYHYYYFDYDYRHREARPELKQPKGGVLSRFRRRFSH